jgi:trans-aconitate methyltransferase
MIRGAVQRYGTAAVKQRLWDWEFQRGHWTCLDETPDDPVYPYLSYYANGGRILDVGCGPGSAGRYLDAASYRSYVGVDISDVAIEQARRKNDRRQNSYVQSDAVTYCPEGLFDVISFGDSLYYIPRGQVPGMLSRYAEHLTPSGVFTVKMHDTPSFQPFFRLIRNHFRVIAEHHHPPVVILVFRR